MSTRWLHLRDPSGSSRNSSFLKIFAASLSLMLALTTVAFAQPPRVDPGDPSPIPGTVDEGWQLINIPNLPLGAVLGDVWASPDGKVYVWARYPGAPAVVGDDPGDGEKLPNPQPAARVWSSALYRYDGTLWTVVLRTPGEVGSALLGSGTDQVFASTTSILGEAHVYSYNGSTWARELLPGYYLGRMHTLAGVAGDLYLKIDRTVLHRYGTTFHPELELPSTEAAVRGLVYTDALHLFALCPHGQYIYNAGTWEPCDESTTLFNEVQDAWGMRDAAGALQLYAVGSHNQSDGMYIWRYTETDPATHFGTWATVASDPPGTGGPGAGYGQHIWGSAANDIYATGVVNGNGEMMRFDGFTWKQLFPPVTVGAIHGVYGDGNGVVWFAAEGGQLIRYRRPEPLPTEPMVVGPGARSPLQAAVNNGALTVRYALEATSPVELGVYDVMGRQLGTIEDGIRAPGTHEASWNVGSLDSGIYFVKLRTKGAAFTRRVVVIR